MNRNFTALILVAIAIAIYFTYTQGAISDNTTISDTNSQYLVAINNSKSLSSVRDTVQTQYNNLSLEDRDRLDKILPTSVDNIHLIVDVSKMANRYGFALRNIKATVGQDASASGGQQNPPSSASSSLLDVSLSMATVNLSFDTTAPYDKFILFLQELEKSLRIMDVTKLSVKANDTGAYDFSVSITTYWLKQ